MADHITAEWTELPDPPPGTRMFRVGHSGQWSVWAGDPIEDAQFARVIEWKDGTLYLEPIEEPQIDVEE